MLRSEQAFKTRARVSIFLAPQNQRAGPPTLSVVWRFMGSLTRNSSPIMPRSTASSGREESFVTKDDVKLTRTYNNLSGNDLPGPVYGDGFYSLAQLLTFAKERTITTNRMNPNADFICDIPNKPPAREPTQADAAGRMPIMPQSIQPGV